MKKKINKLFFGGAFLIAIFFNSACEPAPSMMENRATPLPFPEKTEKRASLESEIRDMEGFTTVYVLKRKDGGVFTKEDRKYLVDNSPPETNRRVSTDGEKAFVLGSNYLFPPENLEALRKRFIVEDHSKPEEAPQTNASPEKKP
jgi:hypothetical protein